MQQCAPIAERHVCCCRFFPFSCSWFVDPLSLSSLLFLLLLLYQLLLLPHLCHRILTLFQTVQHVFCTTFFTLTAEIRPWTYKVVCDTRATHCLCQVKTGPVSSRHTHMSVVHKPLFTSGLMTMPSRYFYPAPRHCQLARPFSLRSRASQCSHS